MKKIILLLVVILAFSASQAQNFSRNESRERADYNRPSIVLTQEQFQQVLQKIKQTPFKDEKPEAFHLAMGEKLMTTAQVSELLKLFSFNDEKLDWAKLAYRYTIDKQNFYTLRESLSFISTQQEFDNFLLARDTARPSRYLHVLNKKEYTELKNAIARQSFQDDKKKMFRVAMKNQLMTTNQLRDLLTQLTFDDEKLDWLIMAYDHTADVSRYYLLRDVLTFNSSKEKLDQFLLNQ